MDISTTEARESLATIDTIVEKTRRAISASGAYAFLIVWGVIWLIGFLANQFFHPKTITYIWIGLDVIGLVFSIIIGVRSRGIIRRSSSDSFRARIGWFWLLLLLYCAAAISVAWPIEGRQIAMVIILFVMVGWMVLSLLLSLFPVWWGLAVTALALIGYYLLPQLFNFWMGILGGGGMIAMGIYIHQRW